MSDHLPIVFAKIPLGIVAVVLLTCHAAWGQASSEFSFDEDSPDGELDSEEDDGPRLSDRAELDRIIEMYMAGSYEECSAELEIYLDSTQELRFRDPTVVEKGRLYHSTCLLLQGKRQRARQSLLSALQENPLMQSPDSLTFPPPVVSLFLEVRDEVQQLIAEREREQVAELRRENERARRKAEARLRREQELEKLATQEVVVARNSRFLAAVPFGVGQFQNGNTALGTTFLATESALALTALTSGVIWHVLVSRARNEGCNTQSCVEDYNRQTQAAYTTLTISTWSWLGVAVLGIAEAQWHFKRERKLKLRERPLPEHLRVPIDSNRSEGEDAARSFRWAPIMSASPQGGFLGISGQF